MTTYAIPLIGVITLVSCANPPPQPANFGCSGTDSPDHQLRACIVEVGKFPPPLNESRVDIHDTSGKLVASRNFGSPKGDQGRSVVHSAWTPDSNFFVFSTQSSGGHSPWHWNTYFYSRKKNKFALLDDTIGAVIKPNFKVKAPDIVEATVQGTRPIRATSKQVASSPGISARVKPDNGCPAGSLLDLSGRMPELPSARRCRGITSSRKFFSSVPVQS